MAGESASWLLNPTICLGVRRGGLTGRWKGRCRVAGTVAGTATSRGVAEGGTAEESVSPIGSFAVTLIFHYVTAALPD